jgi:hypothetical protein
MPDLNLAPSTRFERGALEAWGSIVSGRVADYAEELGVSPADVLEAVGAAGIDLLVDTAVPKNRETDRPTAPGLRCIAMTRRDFQALQAEIGPSAADR